MTEVAVLSIPIEADPRRFEQATQRAEARLRELVAEAQRAGRGVGEGLGQSAAGAQRAEREALTYARALASLQRESGDTVGAVRTLEAALAGQSTAGTGYINTLRQISRYQREVQTSAIAAEGGARSFGAGLGALGTALSAVGAGFALDQAIGFFVGAGAAANELEQTTAVLRQLSGSQERYNAIVAVATANQSLFGGSLNANLQPLGAFLQLSNRTGAELETLNRNAQLLLASAPGKAFGDAAFSLSEFLTGNGAEAALSLADQFNLPKAALAELAQEGTSAQERLAGLEAILAQQGVTADTLAARLDTTAATYNQLGANASTAFTNIGAAAAAAGAPVAQFLSNSLAGLNDLFTRASGGQGRGETGNQQLAAEAASYEEYLARIGAAQAQADARINQLRQSLGTLPFAQAAIDAGVYAAQIQILSEQQFAFAQGLIASGVGVEEAFGRAEQAATNLDLYGQALGLASKQGPEATAAIAGFGAIVQNASTLTAEGADQTQALIQAYLDGAIGAEELAAGLSNVELTATLVAQAQRDQAAAARDAADGETAQAASLDLVTDASDRVDAALRAAAGAAGEQQNAGEGVEAQARAAALALLDHGAAGEAAARQLANSSGEVDVLTAALFRQEAAARAARAALAGGGLLGGIGGDIVGAGAASRTDRALLAAFGAGALAPSGGGGGGGRRRGGGGGGGGQSAAEREAQRQAEAIARTNEQFYERALEAEREYQETLADIAEEYAERRADAAESFADAQVENRLDFYKSLLSIEDQGLRQAASAEFEAFARRAADLRDTQGADVAERYEAEASAIAAARARRAEELRKAREEGDADLAYLEELDRMEREAEQRRLDRIERGDGSLAEQEAEDRAGAEAERQQALTEAATRYGDALAEAQGRGASAAQATNQALQDQLALLTQVAQAGGSAPATTAAAPTAPAANTGASTVAASTGGAPVGDLAGRLDTLRDAVVAGLDDVRRAVEAANDRAPFVTGN